MFIHHKFSTISTCFFLFGSIGSAFVQNIPEGDSTKTWFHKKPGLIDKFCSIKTTYFKVKIMVMFIIGRVRVIELYCRVNQGKLKPSKPVQQPLKPNKQPVRVV